MSIHTRLVLTSVWLLPNYEQVPVHLIPATTFSYFPVIKRNQPHPLSIVQISRTVSWLTRHMKAVTQANPEVAHSFCFRQQQILTINPMGFQQTFRDLVSTAISPLKLQLYSYLTNWVSRWNWSVLFFWAGWAPCVVRLVLESFKSATVNSCIL